MILRYKALSNRIKIWSFPYLPPGSVRALVSQYVYIMSILWLDLTQVGRKKDLFSFDMTLNLLFKVQWLFCPKYFNATLLIKWCFFLKMYDCSQQCFVRIRVYFLTGTSSRLIDSSFHYTSEQTVWIWTHCVWIVWSQ